MVHKLTSYELVTKIMIERVEIMKEDKPPKERIGNFLSGSHQSYSICLT